MGVPPVFDAARLMQAFPFDRRKYRDVFELEVRCDRCGLEAPVTAVEIAIVIPLTSKFGMSR
jgi:hypothetical protein